VTNSSFRIFSGLSVDHTGCWGCVWKEGRRGRLCIRCIMKEGNTSTCWAKWNSI